MPNPHIRSISISNTIRSLTSRLITILLIAFLLLTLSGTFSAAWATSDSADRNSLEVFEEVTPELVSETSSNAHISFEENKVEVSAVHSAGVESNGIEIAIEHADEHSGFELEGQSGVFVSESSETDIEIIIQPLSTGIRILTIIPDQQSPDTFSFEMNVPSDTLLIENEFGYSLESGEDIFGTLLPAWAVDSTGKSIPTWYSWENTVLTQHVDLSDPTIEFPVIADPAWQYSYKFPVKKTASANKQLLKKCFNCYFPVKGAPTKFPKSGQVLPLRVAGMNFEVKFAREFTGKNYYGYQLDATKNHVDKYGSNIIFQFKTINGKRYLTTQTYIVNNSLFINNAFYRSGAIQTWKKFADNLNKA